MKTFVTLCATTCAIIAQACILGLNGLTLLTIPMTLFLGLEVADRLAKNPTNNPSK